MYLIQTENVNNETGDLTMTKAEPISETACIALLRTRGETVERIIVSEGTNHGSIAHTVATFNRSTPVNALLTFIENLEEINKND